MIGYQMITSLMKKKYKVESEMQGKNHIIYDLKKVFNHEYIGFNF